MKREVFEEGQAAAFLDAIHGGTRRKAKDARPGLPRAGRVPATGLTTFLLKGWAWTYHAQFGYRLDAPDGRTTGWVESEALCCQKAREL